VFQALFPEGLTFRPAENVARRVTIQFETGGALWFRGVAGGV